MKRWEKIRTVSFNSLKTVHYIQHSALFQVSTKWMLLLVCSLTRRLTGFYSHTVFFHVGWPRYYFYLYILFLLVYSYLLAWRMEKAYSSLNRVLALPINKRHIPWRPRSSSSLTLSKHLPGLWHIFLEMVGTQLPLSFFGDLNI